SDGLMSEDDDSSRKQAVQGYELTQTDRGLREWRLAGATASYREVDSVVVLAAVEVTFFDLDEPSTVLTGDSGEIFESSGLMRVWGDVEVETTDGRHLSTQELVWSEDEGTFESDCFVVLTIRDSLSTSVLSGTGARLDTRLGPSEEGVDILESFSAVYSGEIPE
ncbi:LPS export ABC transporter periplasmic protein LptC, partial [Candidatus Fermentibacterales bacterium]|nr:LPS export ABC transporter periplasmic protein LptC [Candidatus Fermentibacterales bacterium]